MIPASMLSLIVPLTLAVVMIVKHSPEIADGAKSLVFLAATPPQWVDRIPMFGEKIAEEWRTLAASDPGDGANQILPFVDKCVAWFVSQAGGLGMMIVPLSLALLITAILSVNGETAAEIVRRFARRLGGAGGDRTIQQSRPFVEWRWASSAQQSFRPYSPE